MPTRSYRHISTEERETLSLGLVHGHSLRAMASVLGWAPAPSAAAAAQTPGSLAVTVRPSPSGRGLLARAAPTRVSWRHGQTAVGRDDLCRPVCAAPWHSAERTAGRAASYAQGVPASGARDRSPGQIPTMTPIARAPRRGGHPHRARPPGKRPPQEAHGSAVWTLVERTTRLVILARMTGTNAQSAREGFTKKLRHVPALLRTTLTYDRGKYRANRSVS